MALLKTPRPVQGRGARQKLSVEAEPSGVKGIHVDWWESKVLRGLPNRCPWDKKLKDVNKIMLRHAATQK